VTAQGLFQGFMSGDLIGPSRSSTCSLHLRRVLDDRANEYVCPGRRLHDDAGGLACGAKRPRSLRQQSSGPPAGSFVTVAIMRCMCISPAPSTGCQRRRRHRLSRTSPSAIRRSIPPQSCATDSPGSRREPFHVRFYETRALKYQSLCTELRSSYRVGQVTRGHVAGDAPPSKCNSSFTLL
jgi:hypothetical protein